MLRPGRRVCACRRGTERRTARRTGTSSAPCGPPRRSGERDAVIEREAARSGSENARAITLSPQSSSRCARDRRGPASSGTWSPARTSLAALASTTSSYTGHLLRRTPRPVTVTTPVVRRRRRVGNGNTSTSTQTRAPRFAGTSNGNAVRRSPAISSTSGTSPSGHRPGESPKSSAS